MKKIFAYIGVVALCFATASCNKKIDYDTIDEEGLNSNIANEWLNNVEFQDSTINSYTDKDKKHYQIYLPKDCLAETRVNILDVEENITDKTLGFTIPYCSPTVLNQTHTTSILSIFSSKLSLESIGYGFDTKFQNKWVNTFNLPDDYSEKTDDKDRCLYIVYLPSYIEYYAKDDDTQKCLLKTYVLIPVAYGMCYKIADSYENINSSIESLNKIEFTVENGIIK